MTTHGHILWHNVMVSSIDDTYDKSWKITLLIPYTLTDNDVGNKLYIIMGMINVVVTQKLMKEKLLWFNLLDSMRTVPDQSYKITGGVFYARYIIETTNENVADGLNKWHLSRIDKVKYAYE